MTILQRYTFFTAFPGVILLLIIGLALTCSESKTAEPEEAVLEAQAENPE